MVEKLRNGLLYAGVDRTSFELAKPKIIRANRVMTTVLSAFATILILMMTISSFYSDGIRQNRFVYEAGLVLSIIVLIASSTIARKYPQLVKILVYLSYSIYYLYGILIGAVTDPTGKTVTFMVMLVFMPTLFIDRPIHAILTIVAYDAIFIILCFMNKEGAVLSVDCMDAVVFGILGVASGAVINHMKIRGYVSELKLQEIGRIDQLTQMNNRNAYELDLFSVTEKCRFSLACLYVDVNGLHELNNEKGHEAGDDMLKFIAEQVCSIFSDELSYRIGGDEFVAFVPDSDVDSIQVLVSELTDRVEKNGYHVAAGYEIMSLRHLDIRGLIKAAESRMKFSKDEFYRSMNRKTRNN